MEMNQLKELMLQSLEHERGGVLVYRTALECVQNDDLREEWEKYLDQTENHVRVLTELCGMLGFDPTETTPGVQVVCHTGKSLVMAMKMAKAAAEPAAAEIVACESVVLAETKDHADWELIGLVAKSLPDQAGAAVKAAFEKIEEEEDAHLYHSQGWCRELWLQALGLPATLPPPEEKKDVRSAVGAAKAKKESQAAQTRS